MTYRTGGTPGTGGIEPWAVIVDDGARKAQPTLPLRILDPTSLDPEAKAKPVLILAFEMTLVDSPTPAATEEAMEGYLSAAL